MGVAELKPESKDLKGFSFSELIYQYCCQVKLDMEEQQKELCLLVTEGTWRKIIWDERLRKDLRFDRPTWPGEMAVLYGVRIRVQQSYPLIDGWIRNAAEEIDRAREHLYWINEHRTKVGLLPLSEFTGEQYDPEWGWLRW